MRLSPAFKRRFVLLVCLLHLCSIGCYALLATFSRDPLLARFLKHPWWGSFAAGLQVYTSCSALNADYGFFAPKVGPSRDLEIEVFDEDGQHGMVLSPANREVAVRFSALILVMANHPPVQELMARSYAATTAKQFPTATRIVISVYRSNCPTMSEYRAGQRAIPVLFFQSIYEPKN